jgi:outer membrane protein assembly factor BamC
MNNVTDAQRTRSSLMSATAPHARKLLAASVVIALSGCSAMNSIISGDKVDYHGTASEKTPGLEVPPDLTQLARDSRYQQQAASGSFSAATFQSGSLNMQSTQTVIPAGNDQLRIERTGNDRWLVTSMTPEQVWPILKTFWPERGFKLLIDQPDVGVMETEWAENRAKMPQDFIRSTIGRVFDSIYDTGERDKFRTRVERTASGSEIFLSHRGMVEVVVGSQKDSTQWQPRPSDPELEAEMLRRLLLKLGAKEEKAQTMVAELGTPKAARARLAAAPAVATIEVDDDFDRAWRRVGIALDRSSFTVEDRDRAQGVYFVRYTENADSKEDEPGFFSKMLGSSKDKANLKSLSRYRVQVKSEGNRSLVTVLNAQGGVESGATAARIAAILVEDLK